MQRLTGQTLAPSTTCKARARWTHRSANHGIFWGGRDLYRSSSPTLLQWAGTSSTRPGCSEPCPTWPWMFPGMGHLPPLWATRSSVSPPPYSDNYLLPTEAFPSLPSTCSQVPAKGGRTWGRRCRGCCNLVAEVAKITWGPPTIWSYLTAIAALVLLRLTLILQHLVLRDCL